MNPALKFITIDGSVLEGGGQSKPFMSLSFNLLFQPAVFILSWTVLRNSTAYSCLLRQPLKIHNIRANRKDGGLKTQHLTGIQLIRNICGGQLEGGEIRSTALTFVPQALQNGRFVADTKTAGSVTLLLQAVLPCLLFTPGRSEGVFCGGTNATMAPQADYITGVLQPILERHAGVKFNLDIAKRGYYPRGGGELKIEVDPVEFVKPITLTERGEVVSVAIRSFVAGTVPYHVCERMALNARQVLRKFLDLKLLQPDQLVRESPSKATGDGVGIVIIAKTSTGCLLAGSALGERGKINTPTPFTCCRHLFFIVFHCSLLNF